MRLLLGFPAYRGTLDVKLAFNLFDLAMVLCQGGASLLELEDCRLHTGDVCSIDLARNNLMQRGMDTGVDWLVSFDADVFLERVEALVDLLAFGMTHQPASTALCAPPVRTRSGAWNVVPRQRLVAVDGGPPRPDRLMTDAELAALTGPTEVQRVGFGLVAFHLPWYRQHWPEGPWFQSVQLAHGRWIGEDFGHCEELHRRGGKVFLDPRFEGRHRTSRGHIQGPRPLGADSGPADPGGEAA